MFRLFWVAGHDTSHPGAVSNITGEVEHHINSQLVNEGTVLLSQKLGNQIEIISPIIKNVQNKSAGQVLMEKIKIANEYKCDLAIESHHNAASSPKATGCEVIYFSLPGKDSAFSSNGKTFANIVQSNILSKLNNNPDRIHKIKDRGTVGAEGMSNIIRVYNGVEGTARFAFLTKTKMPAIIIEPFFLTSPEDMEVMIKGGVYRDNEIHLTAEAVVDSIITYINEVI